MAEYPFPDIQNELLDVRMRMEQETHVWMGHVSMTIRREVAGVDGMLPAAALIISAQALGGQGPLVQSMASVVQFIDLATSVHLKKSGRPEFRILVGDYLYAKFLAGLSTHYALRWLLPLSEVICDIHEGAVRRLDFGRTAPPAVTERLRVVDLESASLIAQSCVIGAQLADAPEQVVETMRAFGRHLGIAWGLRQQAWPDMPMWPYLDKAREDYQKLPGRPERRLLLDLLDAVGSGAACWNGNATG